MPSARSAAVFFSTTHVAMCAAALALGDRRVRTVAAVDAVFAGAVAHAALTGRPLRTRLRVGAGSDVVRAVAVATLFPDASGAVRRAVIAASLTGAALATVLSLQEQ